MKVLKTKYPGIYQIGKNYYIDFYGNGKRHRKVVGPILRIALQEKTKMKQKDRRGRYHILERMEKTTFDQLMELYKKEEDAKNYILLFEKTYLKHFEGRKLSKIGRSDLFDFKDKVKATPKQNGGKEVTDSTVNRALAGLRRLFHFAVSKEYLEESPFPKDPKSGLFYSEKGSRGKRRYYAEEEMIKIIEALPESPWYLRAMTISAYLTGMRAGEMMSLNRKMDIDLKNGEIILRDTKAGEPQAVKMQDELVTFFNEWLKECPNSEFVFCKSDGSPLRHHDYYKPFKKALKAVGKSEKGWNFHTLRHTTGTQLHMKGTSAIGIKDQLRHSDIKVTTNSYVGWDPGYQKDQIEKLINGKFGEFLRGLHAKNDETVKQTVKKEVDFEIFQGVEPFASA